MQDGQNHFEPTLPVQPKDSRRFPATLNPFILAFSSEKNSGQTKQTLRKTGYARKLAFSAGVFNHPFFTSYIREKFGELLFKLSLIVIIVAINPFNLIDSTASKSISVVLSALAPLYPESSFEDKKIVAVLFNDADMKDSRLSIRHAWPPELRGYAKILNAISEYHPESIFIDLTIGAHLGESKDNFLSALRAINQTTPIFSASLGSNQDDGAANQLSVRPEFLSAISGTVPGEWSNHGEDYPIVATDPHRPENPTLSAASQLWLVHSCALAKSSQLSEGGQRLQHALQAVIGRAHYNPKTDSDIRDCYLPAAGAPGAAVTKPEPVPPDMVVRWASTPSSQIIGANCGPRAGQSFWQRVSVTAALVIRGLSTEGLPKDSWGVATDCVHTMSLSGSELLNISPTDAQGLFEHAIVIIGNNTTGINDTYISPVHGKVPAAFLHAMALENLIDFSDRYLTRRPHPSNKIFEVFLEVFVIALFTGIAKAPVKSLFIAAGAVRAPRHFKIVKGADRIPRRLSTGPLNGLAILSMLMLFAILNFSFVVFGLAAASGTFSLAIFLAVVIPLFCGLFLNIVFASPALMRSLRNVRIDHPWLFAALGLLLAAFGSVGAFIWIMLINFGIEIGFMSRGSAPTLWLPLILISMTTVILPALKYPLKLHEE